MKLSIRLAISIFASQAKDKLANVAASGDPEDQLRSPFENLLQNLAELSDLSKAQVAAVG
jgi:hypothetical protein